MTWKALKHSLYPWAFIGVLSVMGLFTCQPASETDSPGEEIPEQDMVLAEALADTAIQQLYVQWNWTAAEESFQEALKLNPVIPRAHAQYAWLKMLYDDRDGALEMMQRAWELEPQNPLWPAWVAWLYWAQDDLENVKDAAGESLQVDSAFAVAHYVLGQMLLDKGQDEEGLKHVQIAAKDPQWESGLGLGYAKIGNRERALEIAQQVAAKEVAWNNYGIALIYAALGDDNEALNWLQKGYDERHPYMPWMHMDPEFAGIRDHVRFQEILRQVDPPDIL